MTTDVDAMRAALLAGKLPPRPWRRRFISWVYGILVFPKTLYLFAQLLRMHGDADWPSKALRYANLTLRFPVR